MPHRPETGRQLSVWLPKKLDAEVQRLADDEATSAAAVVRRCIIQGLRHRDDDRARAAS